MLLFWIAGKKFRVPDADCEPLVQEALVSYLAAGGRIDNPRAWLVAAVCNASRHYWRDLARTSEMEGARLDELPDDLQQMDVERLERTILVRALLERLRPREREVLRLHYFEGMTASEVAVALDTSVRYAGKLISKALAQARRQYAKISTAVIDEAGAKVKLRRVADTQNLRRLEAETRSIVKDMKKAISDKDLEKAVFLREREIELKEEIERFKQEREMIGDEMMEVTQRDVEEIISSWTDIPVTFINRIDEIIIFNPLTEIELRAICQLLIDDVNLALVHKNVQITVDDSVVRWLLLKAGEETNSGARPLRRAIQRQIEDELSEFMIRNKDHVPEHIDFTMNGDEVVLMPRPVEEPVA